MLLDQWGQPMPESKAALPNDLFVFIIGGIFVGVVVWGITHHPLLKQWEKDSKPIPKAKPWQPFREDVLDG